MLSAEAGEEVRQSERLAALLPCVERSCSMFGLARKFFQAVLPGVIKPLHSLWNELLGFLFLAFALLLVRSVWRNYHEIEGDPAQFIKFLLSAFFFLTMLGFGLHAFWKARRISKS
jgi:hypothetical protein